jgi:hypothetical protein
MNEQEIRARFEARKLESQIEFERMNEMNTMQTNLNHPSLDRDRELLKQRALLIQQKSAINIQLDAIQVERYDLEQKRKDINRLFHDLKHELIVLNPIDGYAKEQ